MDTRKKYLKYKRKYKNLKNKIINGGVEEQQYCYGFGTKSHVKYGAYYPSKQRCVKDQEVDHELVVVNDQLVVKPVGWSARVTND